MHPVEAEIREFAATEGLRRRSRGPGVAAADLDAVVAGRHGGNDAAELATAVAFQRRLFDAGLAWLDGPPEFGGRGLDPAVAADLRDVLDEYVLPDQSFFTVSRRIVAPTVRAHGDDAQRRRWLRALWRGDALACQLFSEPEAGSDLASIRCTAHRDGDDWVVNGQKIWSSWAHLSDVGELIARTGPADRRHRSLTAFLLDMSAPGITVRPIRQINGGSHFNEVFLDDVRVPDSARLGAVDGGWQVAMSTLSSERSAMGGRNRGYVTEPAARLRALATRHGEPGDAARELVAEAWVRERLAAVTADRIARGGPGAPSPSVGKLALVADLSFYARAAARLLGPDLVVDAGEPGTYAWSDFLLGVPAQRIAGGTDQIQRTIVAERDLLLPREPADARREGKPSS